MPKLPVPLAVLLASALLAAGCSGTERTPQPASGSGSGGLSQVVLLGDSVAVGEAQPLTQALAASDVRFTSLAAEGGGNVVGPFADRGWKTLPGRISQARPSVVIYQITTFDWGSEEEQRTAYGKLLTAVEKAGARLVLVSMPPIRPDDFYRPHLADLRRTSGVAREVAAGSSGRATFLDAGAVWGSAYQQTRDGRADRSADGIHTCPQGAARFTNWLLEQLTRLFPGFRPAAASSWANTGWAGDEHFRGC